MWDALIAIGDFTKQHTALTWVALMALAGALAVFAEVMKRAKHGPKQKHGEDLLAKPGDLAKWGMLREPRQRH